MSNQKLKIKLFGGRGPLCQIQRIESGFKKLGHEIVEDDNCDFIYCNDVGFHNAAIEYKKKYNGAKLILNTLDLPFHCNEINRIIDTLSYTLHIADSVATISETVKKDMFNCLPFLQNKGINVIYQPIKPVYPLNSKREDNFFMCGRLNDPNKRFNIALDLAAVSGRIINVAGPENPFLVCNPKYHKLINYLGVLSDEELNIEYNKSACVLITSKYEGINMTLIEALSSKTPVICVSDMVTSSEFCPPEFICNNNLFDLANKVNYILNGDKKIKEVLDEYSKKYLDIFSPINVCNLILKSYENIKK